ncbi:MAG: T9SS type A sorting domain-containing protein [Flavobacteriales bacterium]|nr:T9SS type A sorting domain-containing protein [Flavobacteriales bacterium]
MKKELGIVVLLVLFVSYGYGQLKTYVTPAADLVQQDFFGYTAQVFNIQQFGSANAIGRFKGGENAVQLDQGIIMTTGTILNEGKGPHGPNDKPNAGVYFNSSSMALPEHIKSFLVDELSLSNDVHDVSRIRFDFVAEGDSVEFVYVFGSEEYNESVITQYNDFFVALLEGDEFVGGIMNMAHLPGTQIPVCIENVNNGKSYTCTPPAGENPSNSQYFVDNCEGLTLQYDGYTVPLRAKAPVIAGNTYRLHLIVADAGDGSSDSGVFIQKGSFLVSNEEHQLNSSEISIFPNPVTEQLILYSAEPISSFSITDISGKTYSVSASKPAETNYSLSVENLSAGLYFLQVFSNGKIFTQKFIKQ